MPKHIGAKRRVNREDAGMQYARVEGLAPRSFPGDLLLPLPVIILNNVFEEGTNGGEG